MDDTSIPCGDARLGGKFRPDCRLPCCVSAAGRGSSGDESDESCSPRPRRRVRAATYGERHHDAAFDAAFAMMPFGPRF